MIDLHKIPCYRENEFDQQLTCCRPLPLDSPNFTVAQMGFEKTTAALLNVFNYFSTEPTAQNKVTLSRFTTSVRKPFETIVALFSHDTMSVGFMISFTKGPKDLEDISWSYGLLFKRGYIPVRGQVGPSLHVRSSLRRAILGPSTQTLLRYQKSSLLKISLRRQQNLLIRLVFFLASSYQD